MFMFFRTPLVHEEARCPKLSLAVDPSGRVLYRGVAQG